MKDIAIASVGIVAIDLKKKHGGQSTKRISLTAYESFTEILLDAVPHVICFALTVDVHCPITLVLLDGISQIVLTGEHHVFAVLTDIITIAVLFVSEITVGLRNEKATNSILRFNALSRSIYFVRAESDLLVVLDQDAAALTDRTLWPIASFQCFIEDQPFWTA